MMQIRKLLTCAAIAASLLTTPASAGGYSGGTNWGAVAGAGILGGLLGSALAQQPQPQPQIIVIQPAPVYVPPPTRVWWCPASRGWYPDVPTCAVPWMQWH